MSLTDFESEISTSFKQLGEQRQGLPVFGLEHGIIPERIVELKSIIRHLVRTELVENVFRKFPLCVVACSSEIGYEYRGTGTDFWPKFEAEISAEVDEAARQAHTRAFQFANRSLGLKSPPDTPWTRNFRHIAWPITNAIAAKEIHRPLASALRRTMTFAYANASIEDLISRLTIEARSQQFARLTEWLQHTDVAAALISRLLDLPLEENAVDTVSLDRIVADLEADPVARQSVASASERRKVVKSTQTIPQLRFLVFLEEEGDVSAALQVPGLDGSVVETIERELARSGGSVSFLEGGCTLETGKLVPGASLDLEMGSFHALLSGNANLENRDGVSPNLYDIISKLMPPASDPMVFVEDSVPGQFAEWKSDRKIPMRRRVVLATSKASINPKGLLPLTEVDGVKLFEVEIPSQAGELHLSRYGAHIEVDPVVEVIGGIPLHEGLLGPVFMRGMPVLLKRCQPDATGEWAVRSNGDVPLTLESKDIAVVLDSTADHQRIKVEIDAAQTAMEIEFLSVAERGARLSIRLDPPAPSVEDVQRGQLHIQLISPLELEGVAISIRIISGGTCIASCIGRVPRLPAVIGAGSEEVQSLAEQLVEAAPTRSADLLLEVSLQGIWSKRWRLGWDPVVVDWFSNDGRWYALSEDEELEVFETALIEPLSSVAYDRSGTSEPPFRVLNPVIDGQPIYLGSICEGPKILKPGEIAPRIPSKTSRAMTGGDGFVGFEETMHGYLLWSTARPIGPIAAFASRTVTDQVEGLLVQQLCGRAWIEAEQRSNILTGSLYDALAVEAVESELAVGEDFSPVPRHLQEPFNRALSDKMAMAWPQLSTEVLDIDFDRFSEAMDGAVADTYEELAGRFEGKEADAFADVDPYSTPEQWQSTLEAAAARISGSLLARKILPAARGEQLQSWNYGLPQAELVSLLGELHVDLSPRGQKKWITASNIQDCLHLWIEPPELLKEGEWLESISKFLQDRQTARAIRYAALRYRAARSMAVCNG